MVNRKDFRPTSNTSSGISNKDREIIQQNRKHKIQYELKYSDGQREIVKEKNIDNARNVGLDYARDRRTDLQSVARVNTPKTHNQNRTTTQEYKQINNNSVKIQNYRNAKITELSNRGYDVVEVSKSVDNELYNTEKKYVPPYSSQSKNVPSIHKDKELNNVSKNLDKKYPNTNAWVTFSSNNTYTRALDIKKYYKKERPNNDVRIIKGLNNTYEVQEK